jgi:hypothetical protein
MHSISLWLNIHRLHTQPVAHNPSEPLLSPVTMNLAGADNEKIVKSIFMKYDADDSGDVDVNELQTLCYDLGGCWFLCATFSVAHTDMYAQNYTHTHTHTHTRTYIHTQHTTLVEPVNGNHESIRQIARVKSPLVDFVEFLFTCEHYSQ